MSKALALLLLVAAIALLAWTAVRGRRIKPTGEEKCFVSPAPVVNGEEMTISGTGFRPDTFLGISFVEGPQLMVKAQTVRSRW